MLRVIVGFSVIPADAADLPRAGNIMDAFCRCPVLEPES